MCKARNKWRHLGNGTIEIMLTQGKSTIIDAVDWPKVREHRWCAKLNGYCWYAYTNIRKADGYRTSLPMHRLLLDTRQGMQVDHLDHDGLNNCRSNIRVCTATQNHANMRKPRHGRTFRYKGVSAHQRNFRATIKINGRTMHLGCYDNEKAAAHAYNLAAIKQWGAFAGINGSIYQHD